MANIQIYKGVSSIRRDGADGAFMPARGTRDGVLFTADWYDSLVLEGRVFIVNNGTDSTAATMAGAYDADAADLAIDIPDGIIAIPLWISCQTETASAGVVEVIALASSTLVSATSGQFTVLTAKNMRVDQPIASKSTCYGSIAAAQSTDPHSGDYFEFYRSGYPTDNSLTTTPTPTYEWSARRNGPPPIIADGGSIVIYLAAAGATSTGFIQCAWAELPESFIK